MPPKSHSEMPPVKVEQFYFFFVFHRDERIRLRSSGVVANEEQDGFPIWHCQKSSTISNEIHGSS
jgi:hypothetical protein